MEAEKLNIREWLYRNRERFITYSIDEIADIARMEGFTESDVSRWIQETRWGRWVA